MADLFIKQAKQYSKGRPSYPQQLFNFIASKTPSHDLAWDVGTGSGQAARPIHAFWSGLSAFSSVARAGNDGTRQELLGCRWAGSGRREFSTVAVGRAGRVVFDAFGRFSLDLFSIQFLAPIKSLGTTRFLLKVKLANIYKNVIATDTSPKQLEFAAKLPNISYKCTSPSMSMSELQQNIGSESSVDLITIAQAMHWFDLPIFYQQVKWVLKKPNGVIAAWCYTVPEVNPTVDSLFQRFYIIDSGPYWESPRELVDKKYETIDFPFEPVDGLEHNGPFRFNSEKLMDLEGYFTYLKSWSAYQTAKEKGVELLTDNVVEDFERAWNEEGEIEKIVTFPVYLRIGKVGSSN